MPYTPHTWAGAVPGPADTITAARLNNIETGIDTVHDTVDAQIPTTAQKSALAGTTGTPGAANKYVTETDNRLPAATRFGVGHPSARQLIQGGSDTDISGDTTSTITFPTAYSAVPVVVTCIYDAGDAPIFSVVTSITTTGFSVRVRNDAGSSSTAADAMQWIAIGPG